MRARIVVLFTMAALAGGFLSGWLYRTYQVPSGSTLEDYAMSNVIENLAYTHYLAAGDLKTLKNLFDVALHSHMMRVREYSGAISDLDFEEAKIRTLNAVAAYWKRNPPFTSDNYKKNEVNSMWIENWQAAHAQNLELLAWAQQQCSSRPKLKCKKFDESQSSTPSR